MTIEILNWAVTVTSKPKFARQLSQAAEERKPQPTSSRAILCDVTDVWRDAFCYNRASLAPGDQLDGPALIIEPQTTTFVRADFSAHVDGARNIWLTRTRRAGPEK